MSQILGITTSSSSQTYWAENARRRVFHLYPQGKAPLTGLLSAIQESDNTAASSSAKASRMGQAVSYPEFGWWEDRMDPHKSVTVANTTGPFGDTASTPVDKSDPFTISAGSSMTIFVADITQFRERDVVMVYECDTSTGGKVNLKGVVTAMSATTGSGYLTVRTVATYTNVKNDAGEVGRHVFAIGSAAGEGARSKTGGHSRPILVDNYTQIFRTAFSHTRTSLKIPLRYDQDGDHRNKAKKNGLRHSILLEQAFLWGERRSDNIVNEDGETVPERKMGGVEWFIRQWELGNTSNGGAFDYRPGGSDVTNSAWQTTDEKRIFDLAGSITKKQFYDLNERIFRKCNDESHEKLVLCGSGFYNAFNEFIDSSTVVNRKLFENGKAGFDVKEWEGPNGTLYFKTHPLFNEHDVWRNDAFFLDMGLIGYRHLEDSDTVLLTNRQANDADKRKDEWITDCSLEMHFPEGFSIWRGLTGITA